MLVYFTHLISYRCGIKEVRYSIGEGAPDKIWPLPKCDPSNPHSVPHKAKIYAKIPPSTKSMQVQLVYHNGNESQVRKFNVVK